MNKRRILIAAAVIFLLIPLLAVGLVFFVASPERYRDTLIAEVAEQSGAKLIINGALEWQLWPTGVRIEDVVLNDEKNKPLLKAKAVTAQLQLMDIVKGNSGVEGIVVSEADIFWNVTAKGQNNWEQVLNKLSKADAHTLTSLSLRKSQLTWHQEGVGKDVVVTADKLQLNNLNLPRKMSVEGEFLISHLDESGGNLLLQNTIKGRLAKEDRAWVLRDSRITSIVSSTYLPGQASIDFQGNLAVSGQQLSSPSFKAILLYRNIGMAQPDQAALAGRLLLDRTAGLVKITDLAFKSSGSYATQLMAKALMGNWKAQTVSAEGLSLSVFGEGKQYAIPKEQPLDFSTAVKHEAANWKFTDMLIATGKSQLKGDAHVDLSEEVPQYDLNLQGQSEESAEWAALFGLKGLQGKFAIKTNIEGKGKSFSEFLSSAKGVINFQAHEAAIDSVSLSGLLWEKLDSYRTLLPNLADASPVQEKGTTIKKLVIENTLEAGVIKTRIPVAELDKLSLKAEGEYNITTTDMDYSGKIKFDKAYFNEAKKPLELPFICQSRLSEENLSFKEGLETNCGIAPEAKREMLLQALKKRFLKNSEEGSKTN